MVFTSLLFAMCLGFTPLERPALTVGQGYIESGMKSTARGKAGEKGAWQVIERWHGKVPKKLGNQANQAERILNELLEANDDDVLEALVKYNSYKNRTAGLKYAKKVRQKSFEVSLLELLD